jgi:hypothetical protein
LVIFGLEFGAFRVAGFGVVICIFGQPLARRIIVVCVTLLYLSSTSPLPPSGRVTDATLGSHRSGACFALGTGPFGLVFHIHYLTDCPKTITDNSDNETNQGSTGKNEGTGKNKGNINGEF